MLTRLLITLALFAGLIPASAYAQSCGSASDPCTIPSGTYHIRLPDGEAALKGIVMHLHGGGGKGAGLLKSGLAREANKRGYLFIAPNGVHPGSRFVNNWSVRANNSNFEKDDMVFLNAVADDAARRFSAPRDKLLLSGFSRGGSMVWDVACYTPDLARAYAPVAGAFWDDLPEVCATPVDLFHTQGWNDRTVPLEGRSFANGAVVQGDVWASLFALRATNGCKNRQPSRNEIDGDRWWRHWEDCDQGRIDLMLHPGGHGVPRGWSGLAMDWFEARLAE